MSPQQMQATYTEMEAEWLRRDLRRFVSASWYLVEARPFKNNWHLDAICDHLAYVTLGDIRNLMINVPPRQTKPQEVNNLVPAERGLVRLGDIVVGDKVLTHKGRFREVTAVHEQGEMDLVEVRTRSGRKNLSEPTHPFFTPYGWKEARSLEQGDVLGCPRLPAHDETPKKLEFEAFLAGYFVGDGSTTNNHAVVTCNDQMQIDHMRACAAYLGFGTTIGRYKTPRVNFIGGVRPWLRKTGLAEKTSHTKTVPRFVLEDYRAWRPFLGAYFACDATVSTRAGRSRKDAMFALTTVNEVLAGQILMMLGLLGVRAMKRHRVTGQSSFKPGQDYWIVQIQSQQDLLRLREQIPIPGIKGQRILSVPIQRDDFDRDLIPDLVEAVEPADRGKCRCLTVDEDHSFVANGIAVKNSLTVSVMWQPWWWSSEPEIQFMFASYAHDLALRDAVKARDIIQSGWYQERYGGMFYLDPGQNQKLRYVNDKHGYRISTSVGGKTTGEGGDVLVIDDPHNMTDVYSDKKRHTTLSWYDNSWRSRLNDPTVGQKVMIGQRSHDMDLFGHIRDSEDARWVVLTLPNEYDPKRRCITYPNPKGRELDYEQMKRDDIEPIFEDPRTEKGDYMNPQRFGAEETSAEKSAMGDVEYEAQYNQDSEAGGGLILKRKYWRQWCFPQDHPKAGERMPYPQWEEIISVWDTAFKEKQEADYSARTTWGTFWHAEPGQPPKLNAMLLDRYNERVEFGELREVAERHEKGWSPDHTLIEDKASGISLIQEFEEAGIPVWKVKAGPEDLIYRAHMVSHILRSGLIWYVPRNWAYEVIGQCAKFPLVDHDDLVATCVIAWAFLRRMGDLELPDDEKPSELSLWSRPKVKSPYG